MVWLIILIILEAASLVLAHWILLFYVACGLWFVLMVIWFICGFFKVQEDEFVILERNGAFHRAARPGLRWRIPGTDKKRTSVYTCVFVLNLAVPERKLGLGNTVVKGAKAFVRLIRPYLTRYNDDEAFNHHPVYRSIYCVANWEKAVVALLSDALEQNLFQVAGLVNGTPRPIAVISPEAAAILRRWGLQGEVTVDLQPNPPNPPAKSMKRQKG